MTGEAQWSASDTSLATVSSGGLVTPKVTGTVTVTATYQGKGGTAQVRCEIAPAVPPGGSGRYTLSGTVKEEGTDASLGSAEVKIESGPDTGKRTTTAGDGTYRLSDLASGTFTLRTEKAGYTVVTKTVTLTTDAQVHFLLAKQSTGTPPTTPPSGYVACTGSIPARGTVGGSCSPVTAQCRDGQWTCSQTRQGTCSSHDGIKCLVCPGALCR